MLCSARRTKAKPSSIRPNWPSRLVILLVKVGGFIRWLKQDYADIPAHQVEHYLPQTPVEALEKTPVLPAGTVFKGDN